MIENLLIRSYSQDMYMVNSVAAKAVYYKFFYHHFSWHTDDDQYKEQHKNALTSVAEIIRNCALIESVNDELKYNFLTTVRS